ncbi:MAG: hypothetical protein QXW70_01505 [Candidatus Anstonellales archaeon]
MEDQTEEKEEKPSFFRSPLVILMAGIVILASIAYFLSTFLPDFFGLAQTKLEAPTLLRAEPISGGIKLSWNAAPAVPDKYVIYRSTTRGVLGTRIGEVPSRLTSYIDLQVSPGNTYYYVVRSSLANGKEDENLNQAFATYSGTGMLAAPSSLSILINGGKTHTNSSTVMLSLSAVNADKCRFKNEKSDWSSWEQFSSTKQWTLSPGDGAKQVSFQCMNPFGAESKDVSAYITLDTVPPAIKIYKSEKIQRTRKFNLTFSVKDDTSTNLVCKGYINGWETDIRTKPEANNTVIFTALTPKNLVYVRCYDEAENSVESPISIFEVDPSLLQNGTRIKINEDMPQTRSIAVELSLFSQDAYECRLKNSGETFIDWEPYKTKRSWTLTYGNGIKVVYYQCRDIFGQLVGEAQDDIILLRSNDGPRGGGSRSEEGGEVGGTRSSGNYTITIPNPSDRLLLFLINNGAIYTNSKEVILNLYPNPVRYASLPLYCRFKNNHTNSEFSSWLPYTSSIRWNLDWSANRSIFPQQPLNNYTVLYECVWESNITENGQDSIIYDPSVPQRPTNLSATSLPGGDIYLSWSGSIPSYSLSGETPSPIIKYNIYRREYFSSRQPSPLFNPPISNAITNIEQLIRGSIFAFEEKKTDEYLPLGLFFKIGESSSLDWLDSTKSMQNPPLNGLKYEYVVKAENQAGTESDESNIVTAISDSTAPTITVYSPQNGYIYQPERENIELRFRATETSSPPISCAYTLLSPPIRTKPPWPMLKTYSLPPLQSGNEYRESLKEKLELPKPLNSTITYYLSLECKDSIGNKIKEEITFHVTPSDRTRTKDSGNFPTTEKLTGQEPEKLAS